MSEHDNSVSVSEYVGAGIVSIVLLLAAYFSYEGVVFDFFDPLLEHILSIQWTTPAAELFGGLMYLALHAAAFTITVGVLIIGGTVGTLLGLAFMGETAFRVSNRVSNFGGKDDG